MACYKSNTAAVGANWTFSNSGDELFVLQFYWVFYRRKGRFKQKQGGTFVWFLCVDCDQCTKKMNSGCVNQAVQSEEQIGWYEHCEWAGTPRARLKLQEHCSCNDREVSLVRSSWWKITGSSWAPPTLLVNESLHRQWGNCVWVIKETRHCKRRFSAAWIWSTVQPVKRKKKSRYCPSFPCIFWCSFF